MRHVLLLFLSLPIGTPLFAAPAQQARAGSQGVEPYKVIANIYYVGSVDVSSHIIVTPQGIVLMDTGTTDMTPMIRAGIEKLGFDFQFSIERTIDDIHIDRRLHIED